jgi:hypothetical protein
MALFERTGNVVTDAPRSRSARWPDDVNEFVKEYVQSNPCFFIQELQDALCSLFPQLTNTSIPTICRALRHDLKLSRKVLEKRARESLPADIREYYHKLSVLYSSPDQLIFIDESGKDGRDCVRRFGWSRVNTPAVVILPFQRGKRVSILAAIDTSGFLAWPSIEGTFTRQRFHDAFIEHICPLLKPWPMPRSIVIMDNAKIHMYRELEQAIHRSGAVLIFLPPYSPQLNPIEQGFALLKKWLQRNADLTFRICPQEVLDVAMPLCTNFKDHGQCFFNSCGYGETQLNRETFGL